MLHIFIITEIFYFSYIFWICGETVNAELLDGIPDPTSIIFLLVYDTNNVHFLWMCCDIIKRVQKTGHVYEPKSEIVCDAQFLHLNIND